MIGTSDVPFWLVFLYSMWLYSFHHRDGKLSPDFFFLFMLILIPQRRRHHTEPVPKADHDDWINVCTLFHSKSWPHCIYSILLSSPKSTKCSQQWWNPSTSSDTPMLLDFTAAVINPTLNFMNNFLVYFYQLFLLTTYWVLFKRIETLAFGCLLFAIGICPGTVLEQPEYAGTGQVFKLKVCIHTALLLFSSLYFQQKTEWYITRWEEGVGMAIQIFMDFKWMKNMRLNDLLLWVSFCNWCCALVLNPF